MAEFKSTKDDHLVPKYFLIVSLENGLVLDISTGERGGDLVLRELRGNSSQLWRLDEDRRLVSKLGLVADIKGKNKKAGGVCHAWKAHDDLNQKWRFEDDAIKSDFNNLVIDAKTQPVAMYQADGSLSQMWYFIPENSWPDDLPVVPSVKYFFIASQKNGLVLDISPGTKGGYLILSEAQGKPSQLWSWDEDCRLASKLGLVADIKGKKKKAGTVCHAWDAHDDLNQKWRVEEGAITSSLNDLVIDAARLPVTMRDAEEGTSSQKWYFIPEKAWDDFKLVQASPNPLNKAQFWKHLADNYLDVIIGYSIDDYEDKLGKAFKIIDECSRKLEEVTKDTGIARTVGGSASIVGGVLAVAGVALSPFTVGASLGLTFAGGAMCAAGGVTSTGSFFASVYWDESEKKKMKKAIAPLFRATFSLHGFLAEYKNILKDADEFLKKPEGEAVAKDASTTLEVAKGVGKVACEIGDVVYRGVKYAKQARQINAAVNSRLADYAVVKEARIGLATQTAAPGYKIAGKTIVTAGTTTAKALSGLLAGVGIFSGILEVAAGAKNIKKGSQLAQDFLESSEKLKEESSKLIATYKKLQ